MFYFGNRFLHLKKPIFPIEKLEEQYLSGLSIGELAKQFNISRRGVADRLKKVGIDVFEKIAIEWENGASLRELSKAHGPLPTTLSNWIKSTGREIKPRNSKAKIDPEEVRLLRSQGYSTNKIKNKLGVAWATVQKVIDAGDA